MSAAARLKSRRKRVAFVLLFVVVVVFACLMFPYFLPYFRSPKAAAYVDLANVRAYLQGYVEDKGRFPQPVEISNGDTPPISWRVAIVSAGYTERHKGYAFDKAWDDPANSSYGDRLADMFCHNPDKPTETCYMMVTGPGTVFDEGREFLLQDLPADLILIVRVNETGVHWMQPTDLSIAQNSECLSHIIRIPDVGIVVLFADLKIWILHEDTPIEDLRPFFIYTGAQELDREEILGAYRVYAKRSKEIN